MYFESVTWADLSVGFETVPGGEAYRNRSVLSYHFYEPPQVINWYVVVYPSKLNCMFDCPNSFLLRSNFMKRQRISGD